MFSVPGNERDPIAVYKLLAEKRPAEINSDDSPFYLALNSLKKFVSLSNTAWFKKSPAGVNKLNSIMKNMAEKAGPANSKLYWSDISAAIFEAKLTFNRPSSSVPFYCICRHG